MKEIKNDMRNFTSDQNTVTQKATFNMVQTYVIHSKIQALRSLSAREIRNKWLYNIESRKNVHWCQTGRNASKQLDTPIEIFVFYWWK